MHRGVESKKGKACVMSNNNCGSIRTRAKKGRDEENVLHLAHLLCTTLGWAHPVGQVHAILLGPRRGDVLCLNNHIMFWYSVLLQLQNRRIPERCERHWCSRNEGLGEGS